MNGYDPGKVLVTGASGQLGSELVRALGEAGIETAAYGTGSFDITDRDSAINEAWRVRPAVIVNSAAYTNVDGAEGDRDRAFRVNADGAAVMAEAASAVGALIIHISTDYVFDGSKATPYAETDAAGPLSVYGASKLAGERAVADGCPNHVIVRSSWLYGVGGPNFVKTILRLAAERERIRVVFDQTGTPTWTADLAGVIVGMVRAHADGRLNRGIYHYSNEGVASWYDFALAVVDEAARLGARLRCSSVEPILTRDYPTAAKRPPYSVLDKAKIKRELSITIPHWGRSLKKMLAAHLGGRHA